MRRSLRCILAALLGLATATAHQTAAHAWSCFTYSDDVAMKETVQPGCDLVFLSPNDYAIEELSMEVTIDGVSMLVPFEGERRTEIVATEYGRCDTFTCTYEEWREEEEFGLYFLSPLVSLPEGATVWIAYDNGWGLESIVSFTIGGEYAECFEDDDHPPGGWCVERPCGDPAYTACDVDEGSGCSASSSPDGWPLATIIALLVLAGARRARHRAGRSVNIRPLP